MSVVTRLLTDSDDDSVLSWECRYMLLQFCGSEEDLDDQSDSYPLCTVVVQKESVL